MTLAAPQSMPDSPRVPPPFLPLAVVAERLHCTPRWIQRLCEEKWSGLGLARKFGGAWGVNPHVDPRLQTDRDTINRDLVQLAAMRAAKVKPKYIEAAEARRDIVQGLAAFRIKHNSKPPRELRRLYIGQLTAEGKIGAGRPVKTLSVTRLYMLEAAYESGGEDGQGGIAALLSGHAEPRRAHEAQSPTIGEQAWTAFLTFKSSGNRTTVREAYKLTQGLIALEHSGEPRWEWPSYRTCLIAYKDRVPLGERVLNDEGPYKFAAKCVPKITRSLEETPAGSHLCGDERTFDFLARAPGGDRTWRRVRLKVTAWLDIRSRYFAGWHIGESANSDTILAAFRLACETTGTVPDQVTVDNGRDYRSVAGRSRRERKWDEYDSKRISTAFERLSVTPHFALVKHPWSKMIESHFNRVAERFDKWFATYWGGRTDQRPWDADRWTREHIESLPTVEEVRDAWTEFLAALHEEPVAGDGTFGDCPRILLQRYFTAEPRVAKPEVLELCCSRLVGPVKVGRDGIRHENVMYGKLDQQIWPLQGKEVWFLADPVHADRITVCDQAGVPICVAYADRNLGITRDEVRQANAMQRRAAATVKKFAAARDTLLLTTPQRIAELRRAAAIAERESDPNRAREEASRPAPESIRVVRPDVAAGSERMQRAAGAETLRRLTQTNAAAEAINRKPITFADLAKTQGDAASIVIDDPDSLLGDAIPQPRRRTLSDLLKTEAPNHVP